MKKIIRWLCDLFTFKKKIHLVLTNEFPRSFKSNIVYIEGDIKIKDYWYSKFVCPCGCGDILTLNLMDDSPPSWRLNIDPQTKHFSFHPSIRRKIKCKSHFWIIKSQVIWCRD